ncbi:MAG: hypothetical protein HY879_14925 [Deltaproteobacteria bacterium]|nr:hypothetical protein [Deltaproteobacteria bacterium]
MRKIFRILVICFWVGCLNFGTTGGAEGAGMERNPFAFPPGVQKGAMVKKEGSGPEKTAQESAPLLQVTTILISGRTKVAAINGALLRIGDEVSGYRITEIEERQVTLSRGKEKRVVKIDPTEKIYFKNTESNNRIMGFSR